MQTQTSSPSTAWPRIGKVLFALVCFGVVIWTAWAIWRWPPDLYRRVEINGSVAFAGLFWALLPLGVFFTAFRSAPLWQNLLLGALACFGLFLIWDVGSLIYAVYETASWEDAFNWEIVRFQIVDAVAIFWGVLFPLFILRMGLNWRIDRPAFFGQKRPRFITPILIIAWAGFGAFLLAALTEYLVRWSRVISPWAVVCLWAIVGIVVIVDFVCRSWKIGVAPAKGFFTSSLADWLVLLIALCFSLAILSAVSAKDQPFNESSSLVWIATVAMASGLSAVIFPLALIAALRSNSLRSAYWLCLGCVVINFLVPIALIATLVRGYGIGEILASSLMLFTALSGLFAVLLRLRAHGFRLQWGGASPSNLPADANLETTPSIGQSSEN